MAQLFNHVRDAVIMLDHAGTVGFWSQGAAEIYGRPATEALNRCYLELLPPLCRVAQGKPIHRALEGDEGSTEWRTTSPTGTDMWLEGDFRPVVDANGKRLGCAILLHDVTKWRTAEEARRISEDRLRESETRYRLLSENATDLIARFDPTGVLLDASPAAKSLFGYAPENCVGRHLRDFLDEDDAPRVLELFDRLVAGHRAHTFAHRWQCASGGFVWCESTARAVHDGNGRVAEIVAVIRSIEERRKLEAKVQNSCKMEAVGRLAGGVAHDFNNLLTVINGYSEMILRSLSNPDPGRIRPQIEEIRKAGERASALTRQLLAFGRQQVQTRTRVNLNDVIEETRKLLRRVLGEHIEIAIDLLPDLKMVHADVGQLEQVLMNLALNARDAMPDGGTLTLRTANVHFEASPDGDAQPGDYVMLEVCDTGVGMDEETRARAFEPFFTTKELGKGSGLGLATVYGIVKQSCGHIEIESEVGEGTTFRVYLPRCDSIRDSANRLARPSLALGRETVLLVEDDDAVRGVTASMLRALGYRVVEAEGGIQAIRQCREFRGTIHLLLTDVVMPLMNGREVADRIQSLLPGIRTLYMSGYTDDSILRHGVLDDGVAFLSKPISHETLGRKVREVLGSSA